MPGLLAMHRSESSDTMLRGERSDQSILSVMNRFVQAVNSMDDTVMIPMRLKDLPGEDGPTQKSNGYKSSEPDLYEYYYMLNEIKKELVSGPKTRSESECETDDLVMTLKTVPRSQKSRRRSSKKKRNSLGQSDSECSMVDSTISSDSELAASSISDESEAEDQIQMMAGSDVSNDVTEDDDEPVDAARETAILFRHHLKGLYGVLKHLTNNAHQVTNKYQEEIGEISRSGSNTQLPSFVL